MPGPAVAAHVRERALCRPTERFFRAFGTGLEFRYVSRTPLNDLVRDGDACCGFESFDHITHAQALARAEVQGLGVGGFDLKKVLHSSSMGLGQIHHMQVVADASAVRRGVVVSEDLQLFKPTCGDLGDEGEEVIGDSQRVFANAT